MLVPNNQFLTLLNVGTSSTTDGCTVLAGYDYGTLTGTVLQCPPSHALRCNYVVSFLVDAGLQYFMHDIKCAACTPALLITADHNQQEIPVPTSNEYPGLPHETPL